MLCLFESAIVTQGSIEVSAASISVGYKGREMCWMQCAGLLFKQTKKGLSTFQDSRKWGCLQLGWMCFFHHVTKSQKSPFLSDKCTFFLNVFLHVTHLKMYKKCNFPSCFTLLPPDVLLWLIKDYTSSPIYTTWAERVQFGCSSRNATKRLLRWSLKMQIYVEWCTLL